MGGGRGRVKCLRKYVKKILVWKIPIAKARGSLAMD